jgi:hypothetical protein
MSKQVHRTMGSFMHATSTREGKITIFTALVACLFIVTPFVYFEFQVPVASADDVTTSVTVLNTPPAWTVNAEESTESSTTTPTNAGQTLSFTATGTDSSGDSYYLLICKTTGAPTANSSAPPTCNGGIANQWAVSALTTSGDVATASTSTINTFPFQNESNDWYGWICDANASVPRCNITYTNGSGATASPFVINHIPVFHSITNNGSALPGGIITWTSGSYDNDSLGGSQDQVRLIVCSSPGITGTSCTNAGGYASSTLTTTNAATSTTFAIPTQDRFYNSFVYIVDNHGLAATSTLQGSVSVFRILNATSTISAATISLVDYDNVGNLTLTVPSATSGPYKVQFEVSDDNSCLNASSTAEISTTLANVYRSGVTQANCQVSGDYNTNNCYPAANSQVLMTCVQDVGSCSGSTDTTATFTCSFPLWYNADPTDAATPFSAQNWLASVRAIDDNFATSTLVEATTGNELTSFLSFDVSQTTLAFGSLEPGQSNSVLSATSTMLATGNVGLDQDLYGDTMCTNWTAPDSCDAGGINPASEIAVSNQRISTTSLATYASGATLTSSSSPYSLLINIQKTTATSSPQNKNTYFGIQIPIAITVAGSYTGQDTIVGKVSDAANW